MAKGKTKKGGIDPSPLGAPKVNTGKTSQSKAIGGKGSSISGAGLPAPDVKVRGVKGAE